MARPLLIDTDFTESTGTAATTTISSFSASASANTLVVGWAIDLSINATPLTSLTYDGNDMTQVMVPPASPNTSTARHTEIWTYDLSGGETGDIVASHNNTSGQRAMFAFTTNGYLGFGHQQNDANANPTLSIYMGHDEANSLLVGVLAVNAIIQSGITAASSQTLIEESSDTLNSMYFGSWQLNPSGETEMQWTYTGSNVFTATSLIITESQLGSGGSSSNSIVSSIVG